MFFRFGGPFCVPRFILSLLNRHKSGGVQSSFIVHHERGGNGGYSSVPRFTKVKKFRALLAPTSVVPHCSPSVGVGVGNPDGGRWGGGVWPDTSNPPESRDSAGRGLRKTGAVVRPEETRRKTEAMRSSDKGSGKGSDEGTTRGGERRQAERIVGLFLVFLEIPCPPSPRVIAYDPSARRVCAKHYIVPYAVTHQTQPPAHARPNPESDGAWCADGADLHLALTQDSVGRWTPTTFPARLHMKHEKTHDSRGHVMLFSCSGKVGNKT